jgi:carboxymethylenebutenolidase
VFYGDAPTEAEMARIACPVYGFYGGNDARITAAVPTVQTQMKKAGKNYGPVTYEGAGHGFMRTGDQPDASGPDKTARDAAWKRWKELLQKVS